MKERNKIKILLILLILLIFFSKSSISHVKKENINSLFIEIEELIKEFNSLKRIIKEYKNFQKLLSNKIEIIEIKFKKDSEILHRIYLQDIKTNMRTLVQQTTLLLKKQFSLKKLIKNKFFKLENIIFRYIKTKIDLCDKNNQIKCFYYIKNTTSFIKKIDKLEEKLKRKKILKKLNFLIPFKKYLNINKHKKIDIEYLLSQKLVFIHLLEIYNNILTYWKKRKYIIENKIKIIKMIKNKNNLLFKEILKNKFSQYKIEINRINLYINKLSKIINKTKNNILILKKYEKVMGLYK